MTDDLGLPPRFWAKVDKNGPEARPGLGPCWLWTASKQSGYGVTFFGSRKDKVGCGRTILAHRLSLEASIGRQIRPGLMACHRCDVRACVRPEHLWEGPRSDNVEDMLNKGRQGRGETCGHNKLTEADVLWIKSATGLLQREMASRLGVARRTVGDVLNRRTWTHVEPQSPCADND